MKLTDNIEMYLDRLGAAVEALPQERLAQLGEMLYRAHRNDKQVFTLGNGGSASTASHMAADLAKNTIGANMRRFRVLSLNDNAAILTALANDLGYENVFREQLENLVRPGDLLIAISASGRSPNVLKAIRYAQRAVRADRMPCSVSMAERRPRPATWPSSYRRTTTESSRTYT